MRRLWISLAYAALLLLLGSSPASAAATRQAAAGKPIAVIGANHSTNWSGYNQGLLEKNNSGFHEISATWTVPTASAHRSGESENSSTWVGIGGGCIDAACSLTDATLIQAGTEQDVDASGRATYFTWWELIPAPSIQAPVAVKAGDSVHVEIGEGLPEVWTITIQNLTSGQSWSQTQPYSSSHASAEWIEETPLVVDSSGNVLSLLPNLSTVNFDRATANGAPAGLVPSEELQLLDGSGNPLATPSAPDPDADGFNDCAHAASCSPPAAS